MKTSNSLKHLEFPKMKAALALALIVGAAPTAFAVSGQLLITEVAVDFGNDSLTITGEDFDIQDLANLSVSLGEIGDITLLCGVPSPTATVIVCDFSLTGLPDDGDYLLTVATDKNTKSKKSKKSKKSEPTDTDEYDLTIGAVGLQGEVGPAGADGQDGAPGAVGPAGPIGAVGPQGKVGPAGADGQDGVDGQDGAPGAVGPTGPSGIGDTYTNGYGLDLSGNSFSVNTNVSITRIYGSVGANGAEVHASFDPLSSGGQTIGVDVTNRNDGEAMYRYRCMRVNLSVVACTNMLTGAQNDFLTFANAEKVMFSETGFDLVVYQDGSAPFGATVFVRNTSGDSLFYQLEGGI